MRGKDQKAFWGVFTLAIVIGVLVGSYFFTGAITGQFFHGPPSTDSPDASSTSDSPSLTKGGGSKKVTYDGVLNMLRDCEGVSISHSYTLAEGESAAFRTEKEFVKVLLGQVGSDGSIAIVVRRDNITESRIIGPGSTINVLRTRIKNHASLYSPQRITFATLFIDWGDSAISYGNDLCIDSGSSGTCVSAHFDESRDNGLTTVTVARTDLLSCNEGVDIEGVSAWDNGDWGAFEHKALCCTVP